MTIGEYLKQSAATLANAHINSARLDCLILLEDALLQDRAQLLAHLEYELQGSVVEKLNTKIAQRASHVPLAYIRGKAPFYGREFIVNRSVLVPRPESEAMIALLKKLPLPSRPRIVDIGTGSGCLGITAALECGAQVVDLYDLDVGALETAKQNATKHQVQANYVQSDLLEHYAGQHDVLLANLPYVPTGYPVNKAASHEPKLALFAGEDGLDLYRHFWHQLKMLDVKPQFVITESLASQHDSIRSLALAAGCHLKDTDGLAQSFALFGGRDA